MPDVATSFGLLVRWPEDPQEKLLVFRLAREEEGGGGGRDELVSLLAKLLAETSFSTDPVRPERGGGTLPRPG